MWGRLIVRRLATVATPSIKNKNVGIIPDTASYRKVQDLQNKMLGHDGLLVWQKRGARDRIPYYITMMLTGGGLCSCLYLIFLMAFPKRDEPAPLPCPTPTACN